MNTAALLALLADLYAQIQAQQQQLQEMAAALAEKEKGEPDGG